MKETVCLVSLGCAKNLVDSEVMLGLLAKGGYRLTTNAGEAETIIINTCAFIQDATKEAINSILQYSRFKQQGRCRRLVVAGCLPQRYGTALEKDLPEVDLFIGTGQIQNLPSLLSRTPVKRTFISKPSFLYNETTPRIRSTAPFIAYLKIAEGCSKACTFCTVPGIRGPYRSRTQRSVMKEARRLAKTGVRELILIAQDTTAYGEDLGDGTNLEKLLRRLVRIDGLRWIRILYSYPEPRYFTEGLLDLMAEERKICPYLDLPIQHIDDRILKQMGRRTTGDGIRALLGKIRASLPEISLRTSLIVGFPGETEARFRSLLQFVEETQFDHLGAFMYSEEEGTPASRLPGKISVKVKKQRLKTLMDLQMKISLKKNRMRIGQRREVLVEGLDGHRKTLRGRLQTQAPEIDGCVFLRGEARPGDWVEARITRALPYDLVGEIIRR